MNTYTLTCKRTDDEEPYTRTFYNAFDALEELLSGDYDEYDFPDISEKLAARDCETTATLHINVDFEILVGKLHWNDMSIVVHLYPVFNPTKDKLVFYHMYINADSERSQLIVDKNDNAVPITDVKDMLFAFEQHINSIVKTALL